MTRSDLKKMNELKKRWMDYEQGKVRPYSAFEKLLAETKEMAESATLTEEDKKELFRDYGMMNSWTTEKFGEFTVIHALHEAEAARDPEHHHRKRYEKSRGWEVDECSCGFASSSDSSD